MEQALFIITIAAVYYYLQSLFRHDIPLWRDHVSGMPLIKPGREVINPATCEPCLAYHFKIVRSMDGETHTFVAEETKCAPFHIASNGIQREYELQDPRLLSKINRQYMGKVNPHDPNLIHLLEHCDIHLQQINDKKNCSYYTAHMQVIPLRHTVTVSELDTPVISDFGWANNLRWFAIRTVIVGILVSASIQVYRG